MSEDELFGELAKDPNFQEAVGHFNATCDATDDDDGCQFCMGIHALEILHALSQELKAPFFIKNVQQPAATLSVMQDISIWFAEAARDFFDFVDEHFEDDEDDEEEED